MKIVILDKNTVTNGDVSLDAICKLGETKEFDMLPTEKLADAIGDAEIVICNKANITADVIEKCGNLKYIGLFATGYNNIDTEAAKKRGIVVVNVPGYSTDAVAQLTLSFILALSGSLCKYANSCAAGDWARSETFSYFPFPINEVAGKTLGIFGYGSIGKAVAKIARALGMNVITKTRTPATDGTENVSFEELFSRSDFISIHAPLTPETKGLVNEKTLSLMKKSAYLINTSRGGAIDEAALAKALNEGKIAGAALDVVSVEPMRADNPLLGAKNCIITPHIAWAPIETRLRLVKLVAESISAFLSGNPINVVNK